MTKDILGPFALLFRGYFLCHRHVFPVSVNLNWGQSYVLGTMPSSPAGIHSCSVSARNPCFSKRKQARGSCRMGNVSCVFSCVLGSLPGAHQLPTLDIFPSQLTSIEVLLFCMILAEWLFVSLWYSCMMHQRFIQTLTSGHLFHGQSS